MPLPTRFSVRVYGFLLSADNEILLSSEKVDDFAFTKLPGGGLEFGEGPEECLKREMMEECGIGVKIERHIYTSGDFIQSHFMPDAQVIGIYYQLVPENMEDLAKIISGRPTVQDFNNQENIIAHLWVPVAEMKEEQLSFPMDKKALSVFMNILNQ